MKKGLPQSINRIFARGINKSWFKENNVRIGEMTARSTNQPNLKKDKKRGNQRVWFTHRKREKKGKQKQKNTRATTNKAV